MIKKILIALIGIILIIAAALFIYRHTIIQYYAEKIIRNNLPPYIKFDSLKFDFSSSAVSLDGLKVLNPAEFSSSYLLEIGSVRCKYRIIGRFIPEGLEVAEVSIKRADIIVERLKDGRINLVEMDKFVQSFTPKTAQSPQPGGRGPEPQAQNLPAEAKIGSNHAQAQPGAMSVIAGKKLSDIIKLPVSFGIRDAKIEFLDRLPYNKAHLIVIDSVNGDVSMSFNDNYSKILNVAFTLDGNLNGEGSEVIKWMASLNPTTPKITMSNRIEASNLDMLTFQPYYDRFSPFVFKRGKFSGTLVFDFNNGDIGSTNEIRLSDIFFYVKPGYENSQVWGASVPDLMRYFTTTSGDIVFDFKLKGDMANPTPYLGPISKRAITSMAIDKISSYAIEAVKKQGGDAAEHIDKAKDYIDLFKGMLKK